MRSTKARAWRNCSGLARCVRSPETTTKSGRWRSMSSSTPAESRGRCGGPKWTSETCRIVRRVLSALFRSTELPAQEVADVRRDLGRREGGDGGQDLAAVAAAEEEAAEGSQRQGRQRVVDHQPLPVQLLRQELVDQLVDDRVALYDFHTNLLPRRNRICLG